MTAIFEKPTDDERQHLKALFVKGRVDGQPVTKILSDGGAAINIMPVDGPKVSNLIIK